MRNWDEHIENQKYWLSGAGYNDEVERVNKIRKQRGETPLERVKVNDSERYFIASNENMCFIVKLSVFKKMNQTQRNKLYAIGGK